jgi:hypothetical protein
MITLYPNWYRSVMTKRAVMLAAGLATVALALAGCGDSVHAGGENAAIHPSSGIWVSPTDGAANISGHKGPPVPPAEPLPGKTPTAVPAGQISTVTDIQAVVNGGCWQNAGLGNVYGAYDQHFWWMGSCADTTAQVAVELYPTAVTATANAHHPSPTSLLDRYQDGNVLVDVYSNAPGNVLAQLATVKGLVPVPGYGG